MEDFDSMSDEELRKLAKAEGLIEGKSTIESVARGAAEGASLGFASEITAGVESLFTDKTYEQAKRESEREYEMAEEDNPVAFGAGDLAGSVAGALALPGGLAAKTAGNIALGAASGVGRSKEGEEVEGALTGAAFGLAGDLVGKGVGKIFARGSRRISKSLNKLQKNQVLEAGFNTDTPGSMAELQRTFKRFRSSEDDVIDMVLNAKHLDDAGVELAGKPVFSGSGPDANFDSLKTHMSNVGKEIGETVQGMESAVIDKSEVLTFLEKQLMRGVSPSAAPSKKKWIQDALQDASEGLADNNLTYKGVFEYIQSANETLYQRSTSEASGAIKEGQNATRALMDFFRGGVETNLDAGAKEAFVAAQKQYATGMTALKGLEKRINRDTGLVGSLKSALSVRGTLTGISAFALTGNPLMATALTLGADKVMNSPTIKMGAARVLNKNAISKLIAKAQIGDEVAIRTGERLVAAAMRSTPEFAEVLEVETAKHSLLDMPLKRSSEETWNRSHEVLALVKDFNYPMYEELQKARNNNDKQMFNAIVHGLSSSAQAQQVIQPGIGWDGKAVTPEEKVIVKSQIQGANIPYSLKLKMISQFKRDSLIPDMSQIEGRVVNSNREEALKPRNGGRKQEQY